MASEEEKRKKREQNAKDNEAIRKGQEARNWERRRKAIEAAAERERMEDEYLDNQFMELFDMDAEAAAEYLDIAIGVDPSDPEVREAIKAINDAKKAKEGGIFTSGNPEKAKRIIKGKRKQIKNTIAKGRKAKGGCWLWVVGLLATGGGVLYGMAEGVSALASALF